MAQAQGNNHSVVLDIPSLAQEMSEKLRAMNSTMTDGASGGRRAGDSPAPARFIRKVADQTRNVDEDEYKPQHVSIGPYHYDPSASLAREDDKLWHLQHLLPRGTGTPELEGLLTAMVQLEGDARRCYVHRFSMTTVQFARMLLLDGGYILRLFGGWTGEPSTVAAGEESSATPNGVVRGEGEGSSPTRRSNDLEDANVVRDVWYLAENQIPFFVVEEIHTLSTGGSTSAVDMVVPYAQALLRRQLYATAALEIVSPPWHLLHLLHMHLTYTTTSSTGGGAGGVPVGRWRTATQYTKAGVTFRNRDLDANPGSLLDVKLVNGGTLEVPRLNVDAQTWRLLRNLMALEQHNRDALGSRVTAYCVFMGQVACTADDVELLSKAGVISHLLGNDGEVADEFSNLCKGLVFAIDNHEQNYLRPTCQALEQRFQSRPWKWLADLKQNYFKNPWLVVGLVAAAIALACGVVQAVYSVLAYENTSTVHQR